MTKTIDPNGNATTTAYDLAGRVTSVIDGLGRQINYSYDNANRELGEVWKNSGGTTVNLVTYTYDNNSNVLTAGDTTGTITYSYDSLQRQTSVTDVFGNTLTYTYNADSQVSQRTDSHGGVQTYLYDNAGRQTSVQLSATSATVARADFGYSNRDQLISVTRYSDLAGSTVIGTTVYGYDNGERVTAITNKNSSAATISYYNYAYNGGDLVTTATSSTNTKNYTYDPTNQLLTDGGTATFTYDANGNKNMANYATKTGNQITNDGVWTYTYDNAGDMIQKSKGTGAETWYYGYDNRNRLITARDTSNGTINTFTGTYTYDILDERVESDTWTSGGLVQTRTSYDNGQAWADLNTSNGVLTRYVYDPNGNLVERFDIGTGLRQIFTDELGSVRDVTNTTGTVLDHFEYTSVGAISSETGSSFGGNYGFDGLYVSRNPAINFALHRQFSTSADAWMQMDPSGFAAGDSNLYRSNGNDPTNQTDPSGLQYVKPENMGRSKQGDKQFVAQLLLSAFNNWRTNNLRFGSRPSDLERDWKDFTAELKQYLAKLPSQPAAPGGSSISGITPLQAAASKERFAKAQKDQEDQIKNEAFWAHTRLIVPGSMPANWVAIEQADKIYQRERQDLWNKLSDTQKAMAQSLEVLLIELATLGLAEIFALGAAAEAEEGIYEFTASSGRTYVGQSANIPARIGQHLETGKLLEADLGSLRTTEVLGGKTAREIAEQLRINELGGVRNLENINNPIGPNRQHLLPPTPPRGP